MSPYPSWMGRPAAAKNSAIDGDSGADPETRIRIRPPIRACSLLNTSFVASAYRRESPAGTGLPACSSATFCRPTRTAQAKIFAFAPPASVAVLTTRL